MIHYEDYVLLQVPIIYIENLLLGNAPMQHARLVDFSFSFMAYELLADGFLLCFTETMQSFLLYRREGCHLVAIHVTAATYSFYLPWLSRC